MPTLELRYKILNNRGQPHRSDIFTLVFFQVDIDQIWYYPTPDSDYQEFLFPLQTKNWYGTTAGVDKKAYTYTNYLETNESGIVIISTEFDGYNTDYFDTG